MARGVMQYFMLWKLGMWIDAWARVWDCAVYHQPRAKDVGRCRDSDIRVVRSIKRLSIHGVTTRLPKDQGRSRP